MEKVVFGNFDKVDELVCGDEFKGCHIVECDDFKRTDEYNALMDKREKDEIAEIEFAYGIFKLAFGNNGFRKNVIDDNGNILYDRWFTDIAPGYNRDEGYHLTGDDFDKLERFSLNRNGTYSFMEKIVLPFDVKALTLEEYDKYFFGSKR